jgi:hypothetical protein
VEDLYASGQPDLHHCDKEQIPDLDPHHSERSILDPYQNENEDLDPYQCDADPRDTAEHQRRKHKLNMELDLQSLFGLLCTAVLIG